MRIGTTQIQEFLRPDGKARVEIFVRDDGIYSFVEEALGLDENPSSGEVTTYWYPTAWGGKCESLDIALREAKGRVPWLRELRTPIIEQI